jgi:hypothetical protein
MNQHGGLEMAQERARLPERYREWDLYLSRPERRRFLVPGPLEEEEHIKKGLRARAQDLHHFNCVFMQPLGWGGEGFAALFEHTRPDGSRRRVVAKSHFIDDQTAQGAQNNIIVTALSLEAAAMREFIGSVHTVQPLDPQGFGDARNRTRLLGPSEHQEVLMMEHCVRGTFDTVIRRAARGDTAGRRQTLDDHTLWSIFECRESICLTRWLSGVDVARC